MNLTPQGGNNEEMCHPASGELYRDQVILQSEDREAGNFCITFIMILQLNVLSFSGKTYSDTFATGSVLKLYVVRNQRASLMQQPFVKI